MGRIIIEIPQGGLSTYQIRNEENVARILSILEQIMAKERDEEDEDILGLWSESEPFGRSANK